MSRPRSARDRILQVAADLFYREGIRAVGVDTIVERSGVGKATLYRHFPTKDDLIAAYLEEYDNRHWKWFDEVIASHDGAPRDQLLGLMDATVKIMTEPGYRGCAMLNALAEFSEPGHPAYRAAAQYKHALRLRLAEICRKAGADEELADELMLIVNGALVSVPLLGAAGPAAHLKKLAAQLIDAHLDSQKHPSE
ncbi:TetR/AcrR family transcriptional regulator [Paenibacillus hamazuiensis]|uniref:TetR/AcrR family transcriptional regulator n=1 Tax=Paenibacillus hamazuiensis TaxID=2936508 RepID=UPI002010C0C1|nr:TetR/AcrR family transcriptional regulator [Paenibacillus hamazuiensis]